MVVMKKFAVALSVLALAALGVALGAARASAQDDDEGPMSNMHFVVVRDASGKPVKNAAVVLHPVKKNGKQAMGGLELKTDEDGKTWIDGIPYGVLRVQVLAPGFRTFGEDYEIKQPETEIIVRLKRPTAQYSVYGKEKTQNYGVQEKTPEPEKNANPNPNASPSTSPSTNKDKKTDPPPAQAPPQANPSDQKPR